MIYLLDTNVCVTFLRGKDARLIQRVQSHKPDKIGLCSVIIAELSYGASVSNRPQTHQAEIEVFAQPYISLPFDDDAAWLFGTLRGDLKKQGTPVGPLDLMIAAIALTHKLILVTHNTTEFSRVPGLSLEDWQIP